MKKLSRRNLLGKSGVALVAGLSGVPARTAHAASSRGDSADTFTYCLNTGTLRGFRLGLVGEIELAARAGYQAIEPWLPSLQQYLQQGGTTRELRQRIDDLGLTVEGAIGFARWIVDDPTQRAQGLQEAHRDMELLAQLGGKRLAAPPAGATSDPVLDLQQVADRYRALLELGDRTGVTPALEIWGFSRNLHRLGQVLWVLAECGHPKACLLPDVYHLYKGGSDFRGLGLLSARALPLFHVNDYPAQPARDQIGDADRVFPGDGAAPLDLILADLHRVNPSMVLSLELFNEGYWKRPALEVAREGLEKMKQAVKRAVRQRL